MTRVTFHMDTTLEAVDPMVLALKGRVEGLLAAEALFRFELCLSEALANLVLHGDGARSGGQVDIAMELGGGTVAVDIHDPAGALPFDVKAHAPDLAGVDPLAEDGRGLGLIMECADGVDYGAPDGRNRLRLSFRGRN